VGAEDGTKARYALVYGDFPRVHRMGLARQEALIVHADAGRPTASRRRRH
jgi:hypothetical protein